MESGATGSPDWSRMPEELLLLILRRLRSIPDLLRSASVCTAWSAAVREFRRQRRPLLHQAPWLLLHETYDDRGRSLGSIRYYSLPEQRFYSIPHPYDFDPITHQLIGCSHGWLIVADEVSDLYLLNPITSSRISDLPPASGLSYFYAIHDGEDDFIGYQIQGGDAGGRLYDPVDLRGGFHKAVLSSNPSGGDYVVLLVDNDFQMLSLAWAGKNNWTTIISDMEYLDAVFHNNKFFLITSNGIIRVLELEGKKWFLHDLLSVNPEMHYGRHYLVPCPFSGDLFHVRKSKIDPNSEYTIRRITESQLEALGELKELGNYSFFIGLSSSMCISCKGFPELQPRSIYFNKDTYRGDLGIHDLEDGSVQFVIHVDDAWLWLHPTWIIPSLF